MAGSQVAWGLDIGATSLKALKLRRDGDRVAVEAFDVIEHDKFLSEPDVDRDAIIRTTLQKFIDRNNPRRDTLIISVAGSKTFARFVKLPPVEPKKIPEIVKFEAIQQIPFPLEQVNWDYQTFANPESPDVEVGIFAMKKELVAQELSNFQAHRMTAHGVQLAPLALYNAAVFDEWTDGKGAVVVDIGAEHTDLVIVDGGRLWLRTINLGGNHFTEALAKAFKQPFSRAEQLKRSAATSKYQKQIFQAMRPIFADLVAEINRSLGHYQQTHRDSKLERIVATGNPFKLPNLQKYIQQELKMEVIRLENFKKATVEGKLAAGLQENILSLGVAYGLALQGLDHAAIDTNLLPIEIARQMLWARKRLWFAGAAAALVVAAGVAGFHAWNESSTFAASQTEILPTVGKPLAKVNDEERGKYIKMQGEFNGTSSTFDTSKAAVEATVKLAEHRSLWPAIIHDILAALPQAGPPAAALSAEGYPADLKFIVLREILPEYAPHGLNSPISGGEYKFDEDAPAAAGGPAKLGGPGMAAPMAPVAPGAEASDRGFLITLRGYTPITEPRGAYGLFDEYQKRLKARAPKSGPKAYEFSASTFKPERVPDVRAAAGGHGFGASAVGGLWGGQPGRVLGLFCAPT